MARRLHRSWRVIRRFEVWGEQWCLASWWETAGTGWERVAMPASSSELLRVAALSLVGRTALRAHCAERQEQDLVAAVVGDLECGLLELHRRAGSTAPLQMGLSQATESRSPGNSGPPL